MTRKRKTQAWYYIALLTTLHDMPIHVVYQFRAKVRVGIKKYLGHQEMKITEKKAEIECIQENLQCEQDVLKQQLVYADCTRDISKLQLASSQQIELFNLGEDGQWIDDLKSKLSEDFLQYFSGIFGDFLQVERRALFNG